MSMINLFSDIYFAKRFKRNYFRLAYDQYKKETLYNVVYKVSFSNINHLRCRGIDRTHRKLEQVEQDKYNNPNEINKVPTDFGGFYLKVTTDTVVINAFNRSP
jgi:hypothetical protein